MKEEKDEIFKENNWNNNRDGGYYFRTSIKK